MKIRTLKFMPQKVKGLLACFLFLTTLQVQAEENRKAITLGFFPIVSTVALYKRFSPLRDYLSESLGLKVNMVTAKDFSTFVKRTKNREYDIVVTAPHFAVTAADSGKYVIRATLIKDVQQIIIVKKDSAITHIQQLAGKSIATPPERALMTMLGKQYLSDAGLSGKKAPLYRAFTSHNAANEALLGNEVEAVIASTNIVKKALVRGEPLKIIAYGLKLPNMATLVATDKNAEFGDKLVQALINMKKTEKGKKVLKAISFPGYRAVSLVDYEPARPYMKQVKSMARK